MRAALFFGLFLAFACVFAQDEFEDKFIVDDFTVTSPAIIILTPNGGVTQQIIDDNYASDSSILGVERDLFLFVDSGEGNLVLTTGVTNGAYTSSTPNEARGGSDVVYDGVDSSIDIDASGLFGDPDNDFTVDDAFAIRVSIKTDQPTSVFFTVYSGSLNNYCEFEVEIPGDNTFREYILEYADFERFGSGCDFTNVGAFQVSSVMFDNVDIVILPITLYGPVKNCFCVCPVFSCLLRYDPDDDTFSYYATSDFGVFNPTTDFSTIDNPPPPGGSASSTPRPPGSSATPRPPGSDSTTLTLSQSSSSSSRNSDSRNSNSRNTSSDSSILSVGVMMTLLLVALLF